MEGGRGNAGKHWSGDSVADNDSTGGSRGDGVGSSGQGEEI